MILATVCFIQKEDKVLMINFTKEGMSKGKWNGVGGKIDPGESPEEAIIREVKEETGLNIKNPKLRGLISFIGQDVNDWHVLIFTTNEFEGELLSETKEGKLAWVEISKVLELNVWADDHHWFPLLKQDKFFSGRFIYKDKELVEHSINLH